MSEAYSTIAIERRGPHLAITLNRPEKRNAINRLMHDEFDAALDEAELDRDVHAVLVRAAGPVFSAGHDLEEIAAQREAEAGGRAGPSRPQVMPRHWYFKKPLIAAVHSYVGPAAIELLASFDFIIATEDTRFSMEQLRFNPVSPHSGYVPLFFCFPMRVMEKLWLMGGWMDAEQALQFQFVQRVVPADQLATESQRWLEQLTLIPTEYFMTAKQGLRRTYELLGLSWLQGLRNPPLQPSEERVRFEAMIAEKGMKEALRIRNQGLDPEVSRV